MDIDFFPICDTISIIKWGSFETIFSIFRRNAAALGGFREFRAKEPGSASGVLIRRFDPFAIYERK